MFDWRRILAVRLDNIGDVVMLGPALRSLRRAFPAASITLLASPAGSQVVPLLPWVDDCMVWRAVWQDASQSMPLDPAREMQLVEQLREGRFDAAFIFTSFSQSPFPAAMSCYLAGIPVRVGQSKEFGGSLLSHPVEPLPDDAHQVDRNLHLLEKLRIEPAGRELELELSEAAQAAGDMRLMQVGLDRGDPFVLFAPGASAAARRYDPSRFAEAARGLSAETGLPVVIVGREGEEPLAEAISKARPEMIRSLVGKTGIPELAAVIRRASLVVTNDSGPMHFADALRRPSLILFSGTEYESQWQPRIAPAVLLRRPTDCSPCYQFTCPYHMECLDVDPQQVVAAGLQLLRTERELIASKKDA